MMQWASLFIQMNCIFIFTQCMNNQQCCFHRVKIFFCTATVYKLERLKSSQCHKSVLYILYSLYGIVAALENDHLEFVLAKLVYTKQCLKIAKLLFLICCLVIFFLQCHSIKHLNLQTIYSGEILYYLSTNNPQTLMKSMMLPSLALTLQAVSQRHCQVLFQ